MNAFCPIPGITTLPPSFMNSATCINPDYNLKSFDPIVPVLTVALIGVIIFGAVGISRIPPYNRMPLRGKVLSAALVAPYLVAVLVGLQSIFSTKGGIDCKILATVVTLTLPAIFSLEIENCMTLARKAGLKRQREQNMRELEAIYEAAAGEPIPQAAQVLENNENPINHEIVEEVIILPENGDNNQPAQMPPNPVPIEVQQITFARILMPIHRARCTRGS